MTATGNLPFACVCGQVAGTIARASPKRGDHIVCHCTDCQTFPLYLGQADRVLDEHGGTPLYQSRCGDLSFERGRDKLGALHLTEQPTLRWYATCCDTPLFNTFQNGRIPYTTTLVANTAESARQSLGPPIGHLFVKDAPGDPQDLSDMSMGRLMRRFFVRLVKDVFSGDRKRNPLFDPHSFEPIATPQRLDEAERSRLHDSLSRNA